MIPLAAAGTCKFGGDVAEVGGLPVQRWSRSGKRQRLTAEVTTACDVGVDIEHRNLFYGGWEQQGHELKPISVTKKL